MRSGAIAIALALVGSASSAPAQEHREDAPTELDLPPWAHAERSYAGLGVEIWPSSYSAFGDVRQVAVVFEPYVQAMVSEHWAVTGAFPVGLVNVRRDPPDFVVNGVPGVVEDESELDRTTFVAGSITVGGHYTTNVADDHLNLWAGLRFAVPTQLMQAGDGVQSATDAQVAAPTLNRVRAGTHAHRFAVLQLGIRPEMGLEWLIPAEWLLLRSSLAPLVLAPVSSTRDADVGLDHITEVEARAFFGLGGGLGLREAFAFTGDDKAQVGIEPFLAYESPGPGLTARLGVLVGLDGEGSDAPEESDLSGGMVLRVAPPRVVTPRLRVGGTW